MKTTKLLFNSFKLAISIIVTILLVNILFDMIYYQEIDSVFLVLYVVVCILTISGLSLLFITSFKNLALQIFSLEVPTNIDTDILNAIIKSNNVNQELHSTLKENVSISRDILKLNDKLIKHCEEIIIRNSDIIKDTRTLISKLDVPHIPEVIFEGDEFPEPHMATTKPTKKAKDVPLV